MAFDATGYCWWSELGHLLYHHDHLTISNDTFIVQRIGIRGKNGVIQLYFAITCRGTIILFDRFWFVRGIESTTNNTNSIFCISYSNNSQLALAETL